MNEEEEKFDFFNDTLVVTAFKIRFSSPSYFVLCLITTVFFHLLLVFWAVFTTRMLGAHPRTLRASSWQRALSSVCFSIFMILGLVYEDNRLFTVLSLLSFEVLLVSSITFLVCSDRLCVPVERLTFERARRNIFIFVAYSFFGMFSCPILVMLVPNDSEIKVLTGFLLIYVMFPLTLFALKSYWDVGTTLILEVHVAEFHVANLRLAKGGWIVENTRIGDKIDFQWPRRFTEFRDTDYYY